MTCSTTPMTTNPYDPPKESNVRATAVQPRLSPFWTFFAIAFLLTLVIDAALCPWMYPFNDSAESEPILAWLAWFLVNLPGLPVAFNFARRSYGEPLRFLVRSAGIAAVHWGTIAGTVAQLQRRHSGARLRARDIGLIVLLNLVVPILLVYLMSFYEWDEEPSGFG